jgi:valyl-tRNA synthetase
MDTMIPLITSIRNIRASYNIPNSKEISVDILVKGERDKRTIERSKTYIVRLAKCSDVKSLKGESEKPKQSAAAVSGSIQVYVLLAGLIDIEKEKARLENEINKSRAELDKVNAKLSNKNFVEHAKPEVIEEAKEEKRQFEESIAIIEKNLKSLTG